MGLRFVIGRAGSGKSLHCFRAIVEMMRADPLGPPIYLIVPKQQTFTAERELTCLSGLGGFFRTSVVSFDLLGEHVLGECGGTAIPEITEHGRQMVIGHLLRKHEKQLRYYASTARQVGLAAELDRTFAELERSGRGVEDLSAVITELQSTPSGNDLSSLIHKLHDLRLLYAQYALYLGQEWLDPHRRQERVLSGLENCRRVQGATVFVDGHLEFTDFERRVLVGLTKVCREVQLTLLLDPQTHVLKNPHLNPDELSLFFKTEQTYKRLWFALSQAELAPGEPIILDRVTRFESPSLQQVEKDLFAPRRAHFKSAEAIELIETPDRRGEVDAAARQVRTLVQGGLRYRDIAVLARDLDEYHELIDAGFREHDIPFFVDRRRTAAHHPLLQFIRSAMQIALHDWPREAVLTCLKTGLAGVSLDESDEIENYVIDHRIRGPAWIDERPWTYRRKLTRAAEESASDQADIVRIDAARRAFGQRINPLVQFFNGSPTIPVRAAVIELYQLFERFGVRAALQRWMQDAGDARRIEQRDEHLQVWTELVALLDEMADVLDDEPVSPAQFHDVLETGLERFDLALTPPTVDQVLVGAVDRTRGTRPRAVILLGMNDGQFPRISREGPILTDTERDALRQHRLELDADTRRSLLDEQLLGYIALTRASNALCLIRAIADDQGRPQSPSPFWGASA